MHVFLSQGYAGTSMDRAAAAAGVSKQTIYSYFQDKEGLFTALIERVTINRMQFDFCAEASHGEPVMLLHRLAEAFLQKMADEEYLALLRVVIAESVRFPELAQLYTRTVVQRTQHSLSTYFKLHSELKIEDPEAIARIFWGALVSFLVSQEILYGNLVMPMEQERFINNLVSLVLSNASQ
jgi:AcrR family transcriptional regulator